MLKHEAQLMRVTQAAVRLGISPRWLKDEVVCGRLPSINCGGTLLVNMKAIKAALAQRAGNLGEFSSGVSDKSQIADERSKAHVDSK